MHLLITRMRSRGRSGKDLIYTRGLGIYVRWNYFNLVMGSAETEHTECRGQGGRAEKCSWSGKLFNLITVHVGQGSQVKRYDQPAQHSRAHHSASE